MFTFILLKYFFNDICFPYSINGKDLILEDRRNKIYQKINIQNNCNYYKINYETQTIFYNYDQLYNYFGLTRNT